MRARLLPFALLLVAAGARANEPRPEDIDKARAYFQAGVNSYDEAKYEIALREFQHAHALSHNAELYFNMAACEEHLNHYQAAALLLRQYLIEKPGADDSVKVEARIKVLEEREESIHRLADAPPPLPPLQPSHSVEVAPPPPAPAPKASYTGGFVALGVTGAFGLAAIIAGSIAAANHGSLRSGCGMTAAGCSQSELDGLRAQTLATDAMIALTGAAAIVTVVLFVVESRPKSRARAFAPKAAPGGLAWTF